jgi:hypothetical protein
MKFNAQELEPLPPGSADAIAGVYVISHEVSGLYYIGSSGNLHSRLYGHGRALQRGDHHCQRLQQAFEYDDAISVGIERVADREAARDLEQAYLDQSHNDPYRLNRAIDARCSTLGLNRPDKRTKAPAGHKTEFRHAAETIEKQRKSKEAANVAVFIEGQSYPSLNDASRKLGLSLGTVNGRVNSNHPNFKNWYRSKEKSL